MKKRSINTETELAGKILQRLSVPTFVIDRNHSITHWNSALERLTGLEASRVIGADNHWRAFYETKRPLMADLIVDNAPEAVISAFYDGKIRRSTQIEEAYEAEVFFPNLGDSGKWLDITAAPIRDEDGNIRWAVETLMDITELRLAEESARENEQRYRELSITDSLTKLFNSRHFFRELKLEVERAERYGQPLSLILLDIDDFKHFNDTYGHMEGDKVLVVLADVIRNNLRHTDTGFRYGGEEFTVLLPQTRQEDVMTAAERLRESFANTPLSPLNGVSARLTISVGAGQYIHGEMEVKFVKRIDTAMYRAKKDGKNLVSFAT